MKQIYSLFFLLFFTVVFAQAPDGYYATATGSGYTLKTQLYNIIKGHTTLSYADLYVTYATSDIDNFYEKDGTVLDMYSENPAGTDPYNYSIASTQRCGTYAKEGDCYNREHIIPQSIFNKQSPMVSDAHFIIPTDGKANGLRSNYPHGNVAVASETTLNGSKLGASTTSGYSGPIFEPIDEFKGDIARMYFYFATRYENTVAGYNYAMFNNSTGKVFTSAFLAQLISWHNLDPVSPSEIARNNAIYARQNNRNPYIDNPSYVAAVWTTEPADTQPPSAVTNLTVSNKTSNTITLTWSAASDNIAVTGYDVYLNGSLKTTSTGLTTTVTGLLPSTDYTFYIITRDDARNSSVASESVIGTTEPGDTQAPSAATNLVVSNKTSNTITLRWSAATDNVAVTGYDVYLNGSLKTTSTSLTAAVTGLLPSTTYTFYIIARDEARNSSVASESVIGTTEPADIQAPTTVTNLAVSNTTSNAITLTWDASTDNIAVTGYDIYLNGTLKTSTTALTTTINGLIPSTSYSFYVIAKDDAKNSSVASATVNGSTTALPAGTTNCASEDFASMPASNSSYTARTWSNGGITWSATDARTDLTLNARAITIRNGVLTSSIVPNGITDLTVTTQLEFSGTAGNFKVKVNGVVVGTIPYSSTATTTTISGINKTGDVTVSFEENSATGNRVKFDDLSWTCNKVLGIEDITEENSFTMYPNPSNGAVKISFPSENEEYSVQVFSIIGQKVFEKEFTNSSSAVINNLQNGVYLVKITSNAKSVTKKLIVN